MYLEVLITTHVTKLFLIESARTIELTQRITEIHTESKERYGAPKIHHLLEEEGYKVSIKRVQRLMKAAGISSITTRNSDQLPVKRKSLNVKIYLKETFTTTTLNEKWVGRYNLYPHTQRWLNLLHR